MGAEVADSSVHLRVHDARLAYVAHDGGGPLVAFEGLSFEVQAGEFLAVVGPSGCGKSSLLLAINGLLPLDRGSVCLDGKSVKPPGQGSALVFQEAALLPWRTALKNVELGLEVAGVQPAQRAATARRSLQQVGLTGFEQYYPHQLSGGMRQRVGLARALATDPRVLLMDEPFGALDAQTRFLMAEELWRLWERDRKTILFVTHDIDEALFLADRVLVMSARPGRIVDEIYVDLPRPRDHETRNTAAFADHRRRIWQHLEREVHASRAWEHASTSRR